MQGHVSVAFPDMEVKFSKTAQCLIVYPLLDLTFGSGFHCPTHNIKDKITTIQTNILIFAEVQIPKFNVKAP